MKRIIIFGLLALAAQSARGAQIPKDACGCAIERDDVFDFTRQPQFRRVGQDRYEISFASKGNCDVTVAIIDSAGTIVRHLASGVLGENAPPPFKPNSFDQSLTWDGKNDLGRYVDSPETCQIKVGLGLKPQFDKVLMYDPNRLGQWTFGLACDKNGVYVFNYHNAGFFEYGEGNICSDTTQIHVFDHQCNYARTIFPFPHDKIQPDAYARTPQQGQPPAAGPALMKQGPPFSFTLPSGKQVISPDPTSFWGQGSYFPHVFEDAAFLLNNGVLTCVYKQDANQLGLRLLRMGTDGSMPKEGYYSGQSLLEGQLGPCWFAVSPDSQWMYASGLGRRSLDFIHQIWEWRIINHKEQAEHAVYRTRYDAPTPFTEPFLGVKGEPGSDNAHFRLPEGVACDTDGRIYVADSGNNRIQIFDAAGKYLKTLPVVEPYGIAISQKTGGIYVTSFDYKLGELVLTKFKSFSQTEKPIQWIYTAGGATNPKFNLLQKIDPHAAWPGVWDSMGTWLPVLCVDDFSDEPTVWTMNLQCDLIVLTDKGDHFDFKENIQDQWRNKWKAKGWDAINPTPTLGNVAADPRRPFIYIGDCIGRGTFDYIVWGEKLGWTPQINVETGEVHYVPAVSAVGYDGLAYSQDMQSIWRVDPTTFKYDRFKAANLGGGQFGPTRRDPSLSTPVAFDYGAGQVGDITYSFSSGESRGLAISPRGEVYLHDLFPPMPGYAEKQANGNAPWENAAGQMPTKSDVKLPAYLLPDSANFSEEQRSLKGYKPRPMFPGGMYKGSSAIVQFNANGELLTNNLIAGLPRDVSGLQVDLQGNVYVGLCLAKPGPDGNAIAGRTIAKFRPEGGRIMVNGTSVPVPLTEPPNRPPDFLTLGYNGGQLHDNGPDGKPGQAGDKAWADGLLWSAGGYSWEDRIPSRFALDYFGRLFLPEIHRNSVAIIDAGGNFILRVGDYGNQDDEGPDIRFADCRFLGVSDSRLFINDDVNRRILSVRLEYQAQAQVGLSQ